MSVVSRRFVCLVGVVVRRYIDYVSVLFYSSIPTFFFFVLVPVLFGN